MNWKKSKGGSKLQITNKIGQGKKRHRYLKLFDINSYGVYASVLQ